MFCSRMRGPTTTSTRFLPCSCSSCKSIPHVALPYVRLLNVRGIVTNSRTGLTLLFIDRVWWYHRNNRIIVQGWILNRLAIFHRLSPSCSILTACFRIPLFKRGTAIFSLLLIFLWNHQQNCYYEKTSFHLFIGFEQRLENLSNAVHIIRIYNECEYASEWFLKTSTMLLWVL